MKMVAASKLRRAQEAVTKPRPYSVQLNRLIGSIALKMKVAGEEMHPLLCEREKKRCVEVLALTSDRGLCGALNTNVVRAVSRFQFENMDEISKIEISSVGKKGREGLARLGIKIKNSFEGVDGQSNYKLARKLAGEMCEKYIKGEIDGVYLIYNEFSSPITQTVVTEQLLPVIPMTVDSEESQIAYLCEPSQDKLLSSLIPKHFATKLFQSFLESYASEQGARMTAMDNATRNAKEMTEKLTLQYNRARQAAITTELMEIIGGAEALK
jgi:F-type H+-transporting ATPase subunit gamma